MANDFSISSLFSKDGALAQIGSSYATGLANAGSKPKQIIIQAPAAQVMSAPSSFGGSNKMLLIGGAVLAVILVGFLAMKGKK